MMNLKNTYNLESLAAVLGCSAQQLGYYIYKRDIALQYKHFEIAKKSGDSRKISSPATNLKIIQKNLAKELSTLLRFRGAVNGFVKGRSIKRNALMHVGQKHILNIDLQNFFPTINYGRVFGLLSKPPHNIAPNVAAAIAKACTLNNELPQGAPTSPVLSNLVCAKMDAELSRFAAANRCVYSRYADDMTFSTNRQSMPLASLGIDAEGQSRAQIVKALRDIIEGNGFVINEKKTRLTSRARRQIVTGLVVNKRVNVRRSSIREARAMLFVWEKFGLEAATKHFNEKYQGKGRDFESVIRGKIEFIGQIRGRPDNVFKKLALHFNKLAVGGKIRTELSGKEISDQAVWVIESDSDLQGSAFFLEKFGIVTCAHCVGNHPHIYHPANYTKQFPLKLIGIDKHRDLARFEIPADLMNVVPLPLYGGNGLTNGVGISLVGYPNHFAATPIRMETGSLIRTFAKSAVSYLEISPKIIGGNSGGPVLNDKYEVVGIAVLGMNGSVDLKAAEFLAVNGSEILKAFSI